MKFQIFLLMFVASLLFWSCSSVPNREENLSPKSGSNNQSEDSRLDREIEKAKEERNKRIKYNVIETELDLKGTRSTTAQGNFVFEVNSPLTELSMNPGFIDYDGNRSYDLLITYEGPDWLFIEAGESLELLIDGKRVALLTNSGSEGSRNPTTNQFGAAVHEVASYDINKETLQKICNAKEVRGKLHGKGFVDFTLVPANIDNFKKFAAQFLNK